MPPGPARPGRHRPGTRPKEGALRHALALLIAVLAALTAASARSTHANAAAYDRFYANYQGEELMRLVNGDRVALGLAPYTPDPSLAAIARDRATVCPSNGSLTVRGRARDMADRGYLSHDIKGCTARDGSAFDAFDLLKAFGQSWTAVAENIGSNNYPSSSTTYDTGCNSSGGSCKGQLSGVPWSVAVVERGWMGSSGHRAAVLSTTYRRFGCAAWDGSGGSHVYACYFVAGGTTTTDSAGPAFSNVTGQGATFSAGATPTFGAVATDGGSLLSDGWAAIDGRHIRDWAHDHAGSSAPLSATAPPLTSGSHTFTWWERDTSGNARTLSFTFTVSGSGSATPAPTRAPTPRPTVTATPATSGPTAAPTRPAATRQPTAAAATTPPPVNSAPVDSAGSVASPSAASASSGVLATDLPMPQPVSSSASGGDASAVPTSIVVGADWPPGDASDPAVAGAATGAVLAAGILILIGVAAGGTGRARRSAGSGPEEPEA